MSRALKLEKYYRISLTGRTLTIDTDMKAKQNNIISEFITFRITKAKAKVKFGVKCLCEHECERSSAPTDIITKAKAKEYVRGINFTFNFRGNGILCVRPAAPRGVYGACLLSRFRRCAVRFQLAVCKWLRNPTPSNSRGAGTGGVTYP